MSCKECSIGLLHITDDSYIVSVNELLEHIEEEKYLNKIAREEGFKNPPFVKKVHSIRDYADRRKSTNLTRFMFCPHCGKEIDWKKIRDKENPEG